MKKIPLFVLFSFSAFNLAAQEIKAPAPNVYKHESGIFGQTEGVGNEHLSTSMIGLQYKYWHTERLGMRMIAAYGNYYSSSSETSYISGDTLVRHQKYFDFSIPVAGVGIEMQRHFYKRVYLFAALEMKGGYGNGTGATSEHRSSGQGDSMFHFSQNVDRHDASLLYIGLTASIGAKVQWNRICLGLEVFPVHLSYSKINDDIDRSGGTDMSLGSFSQRLFLHWRL